MKWLVIFKTVLRYRTVCNNMRDLRLTLFIQIISFYFSVNFLPIFFKNYLFYWAKFVVRVPFFPNCFILVDIICLSHFIFFGNFHLNCLKFYFPISSVLGLADCSLLGVKFSLKN